MVAALGEAAKAGAAVITWVPNFEGWIVSASIRLDPEFARGYRPMKLDELKEWHEKAGVEVVEAGYVQPLDLSLIHTRSLRPAARRWFGKTAELLGYAMVQVCRISGARVSSRRHCAGMYVAGRKR